MIARFRSWLAFRRFQSRVAKARQTARKAHSRVSDINARQRQTINAALAGGAR